MRALGGRHGRPLAAGIVVVLVFLAGSILVQGFGSLNSVRSLLLLGAFLGIASAGQTIVVLLGGIDLSIPFLIDFGNVVAAEMTGSGHPLWQVLLVILVLAGLVGGLSGFISARLRIHPLIVTLGVGYAVQGAVLLWTKGFPSGAAPQGLPGFVSVSAHIGPLPFPPIILLWALVAVAVEFFLQRTVFGRRIYALGASPEAARLALVPYISTWVWTFALSAMFAAVAGVLLLGFTGSAFGDVGAPYLFQTVATVVVGGTMLTGGEGGYIGTIIGTLLVTELTMVMNGMGVSSSIEEVFLGAIVVLLVMLYGRESHVRERI
ncbi:MAG: ABC transporter permease [Thermaerobacter sp.]|nr:ABC transporter permease [Thermaerobacter sp.]